MLEILFSVPASCSYEAVFLETGALPLSFILQGRRLFYYRIILNKPDNELVKKVLDVQKEHSVEYDWINQIAPDIDTLGIDMSEQEIKMMKEEQFKSVVKDKLEDKASEFLFKNQDKNSKTKGLANFSLQNYY